METRLEYLIECTHRQRQMKALFQSLQMAKVYWKAFEAQKEFRRIQMQRVIAGFCIYIKFRRRVLRRGKTVEERMKRAHLFKLTFVS
jgi:hypothetical protein